MRDYWNSHNPLLPPELHTPDCEAHVMPDGRLYLYGSLDEYRNAYCSEGYVVSSTDDMRQWHISDRVLEGKDIPWFGKETGRYQREEDQQETPFARKMRQSAPKDDMNFVLTQDNGEKKPLLFAPD